MRKQRVLIGALICMMFYTNACSTFPNSKQNNNVQKQKPSIEKAVEPVRPKQPNVKIVDKPIVWTDNREKLIR